MKTMLSAVLVAVGLTLGTSAFATAPPARQDVARWNNNESREERQDLVRARLDQQRAEARFFEAKRQDADATRALARARRTGQRGDAARAAREQQMARLQMARAEKEIQAANREVRRVEALLAKGRQAGRGGRPVARPFQGSGSCRRSCPPTSGRLPRDLSPGCVNVDNRPADLGHHRVPPPGTCGSVHRKIQAASAGARLTQPWLCGVPKSSCQ